MFLRKLHILLISIIVVACGDNPTIKKMQSSANAITGNHDGRKILKNADRTTIAIARGASLDTVCTGTTIGISHIITAAHCVYDTDTKQIKPNLTVIPSLHLGKNQKPSPRFFISQIFILKDYLKDINWNGYTFFAASKDIAIIRVREFKENNYFFNDHSHKLKLVDSSHFELNGEKLSLLGYTGGGNNTLKNTQYAQHQTCESKGQRFNYTSFKHDCDTTAGASGTGIVVEDSDGHGLLAGVHTGEAGKDKGINNAVFLTSKVVNEIIDKITHFKTDDLDHFQVFNYAKETNDKLYVGYQVRNKCDKIAFVSIYYQSMDDKVYVKGPMELRPGQLKIFKSKTKDIRIKYHARLSDGRVINNHEEKYIVNGKTLDFENLHFPNMFSDNEIVLCE